MITLFAVPRAFNNQFNLIQRNAILSWLSQKNKPEIILFGADVGVAETAKEFGITHIPDIKKNEFGTPIISDIFEKAQKLAKFNILCYINSDIILLPDFIKAIETIQESNFLIVGRRWDLEIKEEIQFDSNDWEEKLREKIKKEGQLHPPTGIDYLVFKRDIWKNIPLFALGRTSWDNWFLYKARSEGIPIIDATPVATIIHQNHSYSHHSSGKKGVWKGEEAKRNLKLAGGLSHLLTIRDADFIFSGAGPKKPKLTLYRIFSFSFRYFQKAPFAFKLFLFPGWLGVIIWRKIRIKQI